MMEKRHRKISDAEKEAIKKDLKKVLEKHPEISFAYLHGSFIKEQGFKDIDIAVYLIETPSSILDYELKLETELMGAAVHYQVDVRVLNSSPLSFRYNVIKEGIPLIVRDDDKRAEFQENTLIDYFDFAPYRKMYLKEVLGVGI